MPVLAVGWTEEVAELIVAVARRLHAPAVAHGRSPRVRAASGLVRQRRA